MQDLRFPVLVHVDLPNSVATAIKEVKGVLVGRVSFQPSSKQVQAVMEAVLVEVQLQVVVVKVAISIIDHDEKTVEVFLLLVLIEVEAVCKDVSVLDFMISYLVDEEADDGIVRFKMDKGLQGGFLVDDLMPEVQNI